jgi:hypothetical protein
MSTPYARPVEERVDVEAIIAWTEANRRAIEHYRRAPNALIVARMAR